MTALVYRCTRDAHDLIKWVGEHPRGMACETDTHFVHLSGRGRGVFTVSPGLAVFEGKRGRSLSLQEWILDRFGAEEIEQTFNAPGQVIDKVWRPGLTFHDHVIQGLGLTLAEVRQAERGLSLLTHRLNEILHFIEPSLNGLQAAGHRTRELLILACTDVEDQWTRILRSTGNTKPILNTTDYFSIRDPFRLSEFRIILPGYTDVPPIKPFGNWSNSAPTQSLPWYDAYNKTKHDKTNNLPLATLLRCIEAVAANIVLFCARFGPHILFEGEGSVAAQINELFSVELENPDFRSFYVPAFDTTVLTSEGLGWGDSRMMILPRVSTPLVL